MPPDSSSDPDAARASAERRVAHVLRLLEGRHRHYQRAAMDEAVELRSHIAPALVELLEKAVAEPKVYINWAEEAYAGHLYALALLTYFREPQAHGAILELARLPEQLCDRLLGPAVSELLPAALYRTCDPLPESLRQLASDPAAYINCRDAALGALVFAALDGVVDRVGLLRYFATLLSEADRAKVDMDFVTCVVTRACDLYPEEILEVIDQAFRRGRVDPFAIAQADVDRVMQEGKEPVLTDSRQTMREVMPADVHGYLTRWADFEAPDKPRDDTTREAKARQRALEKKRREQRKRSRKSRRRRR